MTAREDILAKLLAAYPNGKKPFNPPSTQAANVATPVTRLAEGEDLLQRFSDEVKRVKGEIYLCDSATDALEQLGDLLRTCRDAQNAAASIVMWDDLPLPGIADLLTALNIKRNPDTNIGAEAAMAGLTGCDAAIAATGTLVLANGATRSRQASLLPPVHIALVQRGQLLPRLEDWVSAQRAAGSNLWRDHSNVTLITGRSRTADIEMIPVFGVHGPLELHVIVF